MPFPSRRPLLFFCISEKSLLMLSSRLIVYTYKPLSLDPTGRIVKRGYRHRIVWEENPWGCQVSHILAVGEPFIPSELPTLMAPTGRPSVSAARRPLELSRAHGAHGGVPRSRDPAGLQERFHGFHFHLDDSGRPTLRSGQGSVQN